MTSEKAHAPLRKTFLRFLLFKSFVSLSKSYVIASLLCTYCLFNVESVLFLPVSIEFKKLRSQFHHFCSSIFPCVIPKVFILRTTTFIRWTTFKPVYTHTRKRYTRIFKCWNRSSGSEQKIFFVRLFRADPR